MVPGSGTKVQPRSFMIAHSKALGDRVIWPSEMDGVIRDASGID